MSALNTTAVWQSPYLPGTLFLRAEFKKHSFEPHFHEEYAIGVIDAGCQAFTYDRGRRLDMPRGSVALIAPGVVHTGWAGIEGGWCYRMLYPTQELMRHYAKDIFGVDVLPTFHQPVVKDPCLFALLSHLHNCSDSLAPDPLEIQELYVAIVERALRQHAGHLTPSTATLHTNALATIRDLLNDRYRESFSLDELSAIAGMSKFRLLRQFRTLYGVPPHAYLRLCRVQRARHAILRGAMLADTASAVGFADQAHMTRVFRRTLGFTPGELLRSCT
ncbi:AraC family transcriptional regulator [Paraburkholderia strydomiana]|uniref:AraC family transcriptional regulator n=1 Tax=Paraburkholderia strydomiana TaxID=1245417 RepID=A0ABW9EIN0_9BURK